MFTLRLLGTASIEGSDGLVTGRAAQGRRLALLAVLALARGRALSRDRLVALLWPEATPERARPQLSDALYVLRGALGDEVVRSVGDDLAIDPALLTSDVMLLEQAVQAGRLEEAVALYRGPLLDGFHVPDAAEFERWLDAERSQVDRQYAHALEALAESSSAGGDHLAAVGWWRRRAAHDPLSGTVALRLMQALEAAGDRAGALQHARIHTTLLREELDAAPDRAISAFAEQLRSAPPPAAPPAAGPVREPSAAAAPASNAPAIEPRVSSPVAAERAAPPRPSSASSRGPRGLRRLAVPAVLLALSFTVTYGASRGERTEAPRSIGVLPFVNTSADPANGYFSDGLSEQIILALGRIDGLRVAARTSSFALRNRALGVRAIADTLDVQAVLEGSVLVDGDRMRVIARLVDARTGYDLWSEHYDGDRRDALAVQDRIAQAIARALNLRLAGTGARREAAAPSLEAYDLYLRGLYLRNSLQAEALRQAVAYFDRAIALEPRFARAWAAKASVVAPQAYFRYSNRDSVIAQLRVLTARALELDPHSGEAHVALGVLKLFYEWDWAGAEAALKRATELNPSDAHAWHHLANYHSAMRHLQETSEARERALQLDPLNARSLAASARDLMITGDLDGALVHARHAARLDPLHPLLLGTGPTSPVGVPEILLAQGHHDEAVEEYLRVAALRGATPREIEAIRTAYASQGLRGFWRRWIEMDLRQYPSPDPVRMATLHALGGDTTKALDWLERALAERSPGLIYIRRYPAFAALRTHPRFERILRTMKFPD